MSQSFGTRPSDILRIRHEVTAYWFDRAVHALGSLIEGEIETATEDVKSTQQAKMAVQSVMNKYLRVEGKARYKDPAKRG